VPLTCLNAGHYTTTSRFPAPRAALTPVPAAAKQPFSLLMGAPTVKHTNPPQMAGRSRFSTGIKDPCALAGGCGNKPQTHEPRHCCEVMLRDGPHCKVVLRQYGNSLDGNCAGGWNPRDVKH